METNRKILTVGAKVLLKEDIWESETDGLIPPHCLARKGEVLVVRKVYQDGKSPAISHENITDNSFRVYAGEFDLLDKEGKV